MKGPLSLVFTALMLPGSSFALNIDVISHLEFGAAVQGSPSLRINPGNTETSGNASFRVKGKEGETFRILIPRDAIKMTNKGSSGNRAIEVSNFESYPPSGYEIVLGKGGKGMIFVGATRAALQLYQVPGEYEGRFPVVVVY